MGARRGAAAIGLASASSAVALYVVMLVGARSLSIEQNTVLLTWIAAYQLGTGLLTGVATEVSRSVSTQAGRLDAGTVAGPTTLAVGTAAAGVLTGALALGLPLVWGWAVPGGSVSLAVLLCLGLASYALFAASNGGMAGLGAWTGVARLTMIEAVLKLVLVGAAVLLGATTDSLAAVIAAATLAWAIHLATPDGRAALMARTDRPWRRLAPRIGTSVASQGASATLTVGFPLLLLATTPPDQFAGSAALLLAISLTRAPLMIPMGAFQSMAVSWFVRTGHGRLAAALRLVAIVAGIGALGAGLAWLVGPWLMEVLFTYPMAGHHLAALTLAASLLAILTLMGTLCQATDNHAWFLGGWVCAVLAAVACLLPAGDLTTRAILALFVGPAAGVAVMAVPLLRGRRVDA